MYWTYYQDMADYHDQEGEMIGRIHRQPDGSWSWWVWIWWLWYGSHQGEQPTQAEARQALELAWKEMN